MSDTSNIQTRWRAYPEYQDSGIEGIGHYPNSWELIALKFVSDLNQETLPETIDPNKLIHYVDIGNVNSLGQILEIEDYVFENAPSRARRIVRAGDVIISTVRTYLKAIAYIDNENSGLIVSTGFAVLTPKSQLFPKFLKYVILEKGFLERIVANSVGVSYPAINPSKLVSLNCLLPPPKEQHTIATFLDRETANLDDLIATKRTFIERLKEKRSALISQAVTRGLNPDAPMKDSGIEWLGDIPAHWEVIPNRYLFEEIVDTGYVDLPLLSITVNNGIIPQSDTARNDRSSLDKKIYKRIQIGDIGYNLMNAFFGGIARSELDGLISPAYAVCRPIIALDTRYYHFLFRTSVAGSEFNRHSYGIMYERNRMYFDRFKAIYSPVPPFEEQQELAEYLNQETAKIDQLIEKTQATITTLTEYRTALISAAVTGAIDVRDEV